MGYDEKYDDDEPPFSQLAFHTSDLRVDSLLFEWGNKQFGEIQKFASEFDKEREANINQEEQIKKCPRAKNKKILWEKQDHDSESDDENESQEEVPRANQDRQEIRKRKQPNDDHYQTDRRKRRDDTSDEEEEEDWFI